jgi:hypothetical protein
MKQVNAVRTMLNTLYSRAFTLAARLMGQDVYVEFAYEELTLKPSGELEAYKAMEQSRVLEQLSLGLISDEEACVKLTGNLPPANYKPLSGTMFRHGKTEVANPDSQTSTMRGGQETPQEPKSGQTAEANTAALQAAAEFTAALKSAQELASKAMDSATAMADKSQQALNTVAGVMQAQAATPVEVKTGATNLTLVQESQPPRSFTIKRDENGVLVGLQEQREVANG